MLEEGRWQLAKGAAILFTANLVGITLAVAVVLLLTGFVPLPRLRARSFQVVGGLAVSALAVVVVAVPLGVGYSRAMNSAQSLTAVYTQVAATSRASSNVNLVKVDVNGDQVRVKLSGSGTPPTATDFQNDLVDELGPNVTVTVE